MQSLRGVTLPDENVLDLLQDRFVLGTRNIERDLHDGISHGYQCNQTAVGTTNGAGGRNLQILVLDADQTVIHVLPGFWHPEELVAELGLALELHRLYRQSGMYPPHKLAMFRRLHEAQLARYGATAARRSEWQDFDGWEEFSRAGGGLRDTLVYDDAGQPMRGANGRPVMRPMLQVVHERQMAQPFRKLADFDMETFVDYGRPFYDNNSGLDKGRNFPRAVASNEKRDRIEAKEQALAAKEQAKAEKEQKKRSRG